MKLDYDQTADHRYVRRLCRLYLRAQKGEIVSGMSAARDFQQYYGMHVDHHEFAYALDEMSRSDEAVHYSHHGGDTQYRVL